MLKFKSRFGPGALTATLLGMLATVAVACSSGGTDAPAASATATAAGKAAATSTAAAGGGFLIVADGAAERVLVYTVPQMELAATFERTKLSAHAGAVALSDGRVLFANDVTKELVALKLANGAKPEIVGKAKMVTPAMWGAIDADQKYLAASSGTNANGDIESMTVVDLKTYQSVSFEIDTKGEELHPLIQGDTLIAAVKGNVYTYSISEVMKGGTPKVLSTSSVDDGLHGGVQVPALNRIYLTTLKHMAAFEVKGTTLAAAQPIAWGAEGRTWGRNARPRLSYDGNYIYGAASATVPAEAWATRENDVHIGDVRSGASKRVPLGNGVIGRYQLSKTHALFTQIHPDGDHALFFDVDAKSAKFQTVTARVKLDPLEKGPVAGKATTGTEARAAAITPDGRWAFVSHGGEGLVSVIDVQQGRVMQKAKVGAALPGGGYLFAVQPGTAPVDLAIR